MTKSWLCMVEEDGVLALPDEALEGLGWSCGDVLHWTITEKGSALVRKCTEITPMDLYLWMDDYLEEVRNGQSFVVVDMDKKYLLAPVAAFTDLSVIETSAEGA